MDFKSIIYIFRLAYTYVQMYFIRWKVDSQIYKNPNYIRIQGYDKGEIYDFYIPYCRHQRQRHQMRRIALVSHHSNDEVIKLYPGCRLDFNAPDLKGSHFLVETKDGELHEKEFLH